MASVHEDALDQSEQGDFKKVERSSERDKDKSGKNKNVGAATKGKDLSHVPCKFFRLGQCTAGSSCVFSHTLIEPGATKEVCAWFVKGNCKFGHKCALAHILPGQPMSMDRKNKKAAQQQQQQSGPTSGKGDRESKKEQRGNVPHSTNGSSKSNGKERSAISALTSRLAVTSRAPMAISKATMSPSAPAPALRDDDFAFGPMEDVDDPIQQTLEMAEEKLSSGRATAWRQETVVSSTSAVSGTTHAPISPSKLKEVETIESSPTAAPDQRKPSPLPLSTPSAPRGYTKAKGSPALDFGPVGSPPRSSPISSGGMLPTSPSKVRVNGFSPGTSPSQQHVPIASNSPFSAPVAQTLFSNYGGEREISTANEFSARPGIAASLGPTTILGSRAWDIHGPPTKTTSRTEGLDDDDIEDFLPSSLNDLLTPAERQRRASRNSGVKPNFEALHHRHSRSVPAVSLFDHVKSIWSEDQVHSPTSALSNTTSRAFAPSSYTGSDTMIGNHISTSNVSAGFLSGLHMTRPTTNTQRSISDTHAMPPLSSSATKPSPFSTRPTFDQPNYGYHPQPPSSQHEDVLHALNHMALSPSSRALQTHAPGTSLPQGLAAGYSRIHARPPSIFSALSPPNSAGLDDPQHSPLAGAQLGHRSGMHGNLSSGGTPQPPSPHSAASLVTRRGRGNQLPMALSSPLAGPVITNDLVDDEVFDMDPQT